MTPSMNRIWTAATLLAAAAALTHTFGCAGSGKETAQLQPAETPVLEQAEDAEFNALMGEMGNLDFASANPDIDYQSPEETIAASPEGTPPVVNPAPENGAPGARSNTGLEIETGGVVQAPAIASETDSPGNAEPDDGLAIGAGGPEAPSIESRIEEAVRSLRTVIADSGDQALSPVGAMLRIALLESVQPGVFEMTYGTLAEAADAAGLTDDEREVLGSTLELASSLRGEFDLGLVDLDRIVRAIEQASEDMRTLKLLTIEDARFCTQVSSYGVYRELPKYQGRYKFIAGRPHRVIVYTEIDHFTRSPASRGGVDGYVVNMKQSLEMYLVGTEDAPDSQNTLVLQHDPEIIVDFSQRPRRDFFIAQIVDLPTNLSLGSYRLKVTTTDIATGEVVERGIDFDMVASAGAFKGPGNSLDVDRGPFNPDR